MADRKGLGAPIPTAVSPREHPVPPARDGAVAASVPTRESGDLVLVAGESRWSLVGTRILVGRAGGEADADIEIDHDSVSRRHAELVATVDGWAVRDLGSTNGTKVGSRALPPGELAPLEAGATVWFGDYRSTTR